MTSCDPPTPDIELLIEEPFQGLAPPYDKTGYFELFHRIDVLKRELDRLRAVNFEFEETRSKRILAVRKAIVAIERHTHSEEFGSARADGKPLLGTAQEQLILDALTCHGYDPKRLVKAAGKSGPKKQVKNSLLSSHPNVFRSNHAFDAAWKRLRAAGHISDATPP